LFRVIAGRTKVEAEAAACASVKERVLTKAGVWKSLIFTVLALIATNNTALAQSTTQQTKETPAPPQSSIQVVNTDQKPLAPKAKTDTPDKPDKPEKVVPQQKAAETRVQVEAQPIVVPPAPQVVKKSATAISIPASVASKEADSDSNFVERPAVATNVSVGSVFGYRRDPFTRRSKFHSGVDIKARWGDAVGASQAGTVQFAGWYHGYGNLIIVDHGGGVATHYAHLSSFDVQVGDHVERGMILGRAGSTGRATSPHLHYEVRIDGSAINPFQTLALDPSSEYFKQTQPLVNANRTDAANPSGASREH